MDANFICYFCEGSYSTNIHHCSKECRVEGDRVIHYDFCVRCQMILNRFVRNFIDKPRLRIEEK